MAAKQRASFWDALLVLGLAILLAFAAANFAIAVIGAGAALLLLDLVGTPFAWIFVVVLAALAAVEIWLWIALRIPKASTEWIDLTKTRRFRAVATFVFGLFALAGLVALTAAFAALTASLQAEDLVTEKPAADADGFVWTALGYYAWHLLDAIPVLEVPETLNWSSPPTSLTDHLGGALLLLFKLVAIIPIVGFSLGLIRAWKVPSGQAAGA